MKDKDSKTGETSEHTKKGRTAQETIYLMLDWLYEANRDDSAKWEIIKSNGVYELNITMPSAAKVNDKMHVVSNMHNQTAQMKLTFNGESFVTDYR
jgi:hypothetical protein